MRSKLDFLKNLLALSNAFKDEINNLGENEFKLAILFYFCHSPHTCNRVFHFSIGKTS